MYLAVRAGLQLLNIKKQCKDAWFGNCKPCVFFATVTMSAQVKEDKYGQGENDHAPGAADDVPFEFMGHHALIA